VNASSSLGRDGEDAAVRFLERQRCTILDRNWRCSLGEVDVVARDGATLVFCEVKARRSSRFGEPHEAVGARKQARLRALAGRWLSEHRVTTTTVRFDVVSVLVTPSGARLEYVRDAF
jgi:putative endonuclease